MKSLCYVIIIFPTYFCYRMLNILYLFRNLADPILTYRLYNDFLEAISKSLVENVSFVAYERISK